MDEQKSYTATLLGCGKMGSAMLQSWLDHSIISEVQVIDPMPLPKILANAPCVKHVTKSDQAIETDILILAVKPQILEKATSGIKDNISSKTVILSIAAGKNLQSIERIFGSEQPIVRSMPNTPAAIGKGVSVAISNSSISSEQKECVSTLLKTLGTMQWIEDESLMNAVTALSGSGPAYVFYMIEMLAKSGEVMGLEPDLATALARQTVIGSAALAEIEQDVSAGKLRENVTSPKGTTEAALKILMDGRAQSIFNEALSAAKKRGKELDT